MAKKTQEYRYGVPAKYLKGLGDEEAKKRAAEIKRRSDKYEKGEEKVDGKIKSGDAPDTKDSPSTKKYHKKYGKPKSMKESTMSKSILAEIIQEKKDGESKSKFINKVHNDTGISKSILNQVYSKGVAAAKSSGHRRGANPISWAKARVYSFVDNDKKHDRELHRKRKDDDKPKWAKGKDKDDDKKKNESLHENHETAGGWFENAFEKVMHPYFERMGVDNDVYWKVYRMFYKQFIIPMNPSAYQHEDSRDYDVVELEGDPDGSYWVFKMDRVLPIVKKMVARVTRGGVKERMRFREYISREGDVVPMKRKTSHCTCPYDDEDDTKDMGTDPNCPYHGSSVDERKRPSATLTCEKCEGDGCTHCDYTGRKVLERDGRDARWSANVNHIVSLAMKNGMEPEEVQKRGERLERMGDPKAAIWMAAADKYRKVDSYRR